MRWCNYCEKVVQPKRSFGGLDLLLTLITGGVYLIFYFMKPKRCPSCNGHNFSSVEKGREMQAISK